MRDRVDQLDKYVGKLLGKKAKSDPLAFGWLDKMPFTDEDFGLIGGPQNGTQKGAAGNGVPGRGPASQPKGNNGKKNGGQYWLKPGYQPNLPGMPPWSIWAEQRRKWHWSPQRARDEYNSIYKKHRFSIDQDKADWMEPLVLGVAGGRGLASRAKATKASQQQAREWLERKELAQAAGAKHKGKSSEKLAEETVEPIWDRYWGPGEGKINVRDKKKTRGDVREYTEIKHTTGGYEQAKRDFQNIPGITKPRSHKDRVRGIWVKKAPDGNTFILRRISTEQIEPWKSSNTWKSKKTLPTLERQTKPPRGGIEYRKLRYAPEGWDIIFKEKGKP